MKTTLYFGQPPMSSHTCFKDLGEVQDFLDSRGAQIAAQKAAQRASESETSSKESNVSEEVHRLHYCISTDVGLNGLRACSLMRPQYKMRLPSDKSITGVAMECVACENHFKGLLLHGWVRLQEELQMPAKNVESASEATSAAASGATSTEETAIPKAVCGYCCTNEAVVDGLCEDCLDLATAPSTDASRIKSGSVGHCLNRDLVHGCLVYAETNSQYCAFCRMRGADNKIFTQIATPSLRQPRIRTLTTSSRPCFITKGCTGAMTAVLRSYRVNEPAELWWSCGTCRKNQLAERTWAILDPRVTQVQAEEAQVEALQAPASEASQEADLTEPSNTDANEAYMHIREMMSED